MNSKNRWIWQNPNWTGFQWQDDLISPRLRDLHQKLGLLLGKASVNTSNIHTSNEQPLNTLLANIIASSAIENEQLNVDSVRSSLAKHLGLSSDRNHTQPLIAQKVLPQ